MSMNRRSFIKLLGASAGVGLAGAPLFSVANEIMPKKGRRVVVVGGGYGGTIAAKYIRMADPTIEVVLVTASKEYISGPLSTLVIAGFRELKDNTITYEKLESNHGIKIVYANAESVDAGAKVLVTDQGTLAYDRLVLSPGIDFRFEEIEGYDPKTTPESVPHGWLPGAQTLLLKKQLESMKQGGVVVLTVPPTPYRCPPGPYERISLFGHYLKKNNPKAKIIVWDANEKIASKGPLFQKGWAKHYGFDAKDSSKGMISYNSNSKVTKIDVKGMEIDNGVEAIKADVINIIPPQKAGLIAFKAGVVGEDKKWCPVNPMNFESKLAPGIHVIGDSCSTGAVTAPMPKSGYSANSQAKVCAMNIVQAMNGKPLIPPSMVNVCYSFITDKEAISVAMVYKEEGGKIAEVKGAGGVSPDLSEMDARYAYGWIKNILTEMST